MAAEDRKSTRLNSSHDQISYAVFCLKKKKNRYRPDYLLTNTYLSYHARRIPHKLLDQLEEHTFVHALSSSLLSDNLFATLCQSMPRLSVSRDQRKSARLRRSVSHLTACTHLCDCLLTLTRLQSYLYIYILIFLRSHSSVARIFFFFFK